VLENFLMGFDGSLGQKTKIITPERFASYYSNVSASIDSDDYFELVIRNVWHLSGGEGQCAASRSRALSPRCHVSCLCSSDVQDLNQCRMV
jgi:hypothetical protein